MSSSWRRAIRIWIANQKEKKGNMNSLNSGCHSCRAELGYVLAYKYWGKGITIFSVLEWSNLERIEALVDINNIGSQRVLEKVGFLREGVLRKFMNIKGKSRDMVIFSLLYTDVVQHILEIKRRSQRKSFGNIVAVIYCLITIRTVIVLNHCLN
uniref:Uncharacterized protein LOC104240057 n=1 Tax=Nicotiana sylvestris TaxID=4096 RepID=A0A1U7XQH9_NICSY|nr:PREDICTED: uncharacterized protein LOC104240057 [Nicotiana sylvestris]